MDDLDDDLGDLEDKNQDGEFAEFENEDKGEEAEKDLSGSDYDHSEGEVDEPPPPEDPEYKQQGIKVFPDMPGLCPFLNYPSHSEANYFNLGKGGFDLPDADFGDSGDEDEPPPPDDLDGPKPVGLVGELEANLQARLSGQKEASSIIQKRERKKQQEESLFDDQSDLFATEPEKTESKQEGGSSLFNEGSSLFDDSSNIFGNSETKEEKAETGLEDEGDLFAPSTSIYFNLLFFEDYNY